MDEEAFCKRVITSCYTKIIEDLEPDPLIDEMIVENFLPPVAIRDIREQGTTSQKSRKVIERVLSRGPEGYRLFLRMLGNSGNEYLKDHIQKKERSLREKYPPKNEEPKANRDIKHRAGHSTGPTKTPIPTQEQVPGTVASQKAPMPTQVQIPGTVARQQAPTGTIASQPESTVFNTRNEYASVNYSKQSGLKGKLPEASSAANYVNTGPVLEPGPPAPISSNMRLGGQPLALAMSQLSVQAQDSEDQDEDDVDASPFDEVSNSPRHSHDKDKDSVDARPYAEGGTSLRQTSESLDTSFYEVKMVKKTRTKFDGRLVDVDVQSCEKAIKGKTPIAVGGYGDVYLVRDQILLVDCVIKKICYIGNDGKERSAASELLAARLMHFGIVPLIGMAEDPKPGIYYFLFPYMVYGSLAEKLKSDREKIETNKVVELTKDRRRRILTQIASAIGFLHTAVSKFRESYIHGDITTKNIVLDWKYNARLIDFGLARECTAGKEGVTLTHAELLGSPGYFQTSERKKMTLKKDIFCLGVVTLEVLTSMPPISGNKYLYNYNSGNIKHCYDDYEEKIERVWGSSYDIVEPYFMMAQLCLKEEVDIKEVIDQFKATCASPHSSSIFQGECNSLPKYWDDPQKDSQEGVKCFICLINPESLQVSTLLDHKSCDLHICVQCLRNSYLNPIQCPSCLEKLESPIGNNWAAILVAGNDTENRTKAETFYQDTKSLEKAITSRHPWTIGISEKHVHCVAARQPGEASQLLPEVENSFKKIKKYVTERIENVDADSKFKLHTLLFYFSGHHNADNGFQLGMNGENKEYLSLDGLRKLIIDLYPDCDRVIILLDCCNAPVVDLKLDQGITYFQLNSCTVNERTSVPYNKKSPFTECVVQCLKGKSSQEKCPLAQGKKSCKICDDFDPKKGFIMIDNLKDFVQQHFTEPKVTYFAQHETVGQNTVFAYFLDTKVEYIFHLCHPLKSSKEYQLPKQPDSLQTLLVDLFKVFKEKYLSKQVKDDFADVLMLEKRTGPKSHHFGELRSLEQIEDAWNGKRKLFVRLRPLEQLSNGKVGCKLDHEKTDLLLKYLTDEKVKATGIADYSQKIDHGITEVAISLENGGARTLWDCLRKELIPSKSCTSFNHLKEVMNIIKNNEEIKQEGKLVFIFHLEASGKQIQNFYTIELRPGNNGASSC